jgi:O-antigen/teichoic acid export membrane protein
MARRLVGGAAWVLGARVVYVVTTIGIGGVVARLLPPDGAGTYFVAISVATSLAVLAELGLRTLMVRLVASALSVRDYGRLRSAIVRILAIVAAAATSIGLVVGSDVGRGAFAAAFSTTDLAAVAPLVGLLVVVRAVGLLRAEAFRGLQDFRLASAFDGVDAQVLGAAFLLALALVWPDAADVHLVLWLTILAWVPGLIIAASILHRRIRRLQGDGSVRVSEIARSGWPLSIQDIGVLLLVHADLWIVAAFLGATEAALYGAARRMVAVVAFPLLIVNAVLSPVLAELATQQQWARFEQVLRSAAALTAVPVAAALAAEAVPTAVATAVSLTTAATGSAAPPEIVTRVTAPAKTTM